MVDGEQDQSAKKYGSPLKHEPGFNGPTRSRSCTDVIFLLLFFAFLAAWGGVAYYGLVKGDRARIFTATDSRGRRCGVDSEVIDKKYLFFFDLTACANPKTLINGCDTPQVCVSECPTRNWFSKGYRDGLQAFNRTAVQSNLICTDRTIASQINTPRQLQDVVDRQICADWYITSRPVQGRCIDLIGNSTELNWKALKDGLSSLTFMLRGWLNNYTDGDKVHEVGAKVIDDLFNSWKNVVLALFITIFVSLFYISLLRWIAGILTWLSLIGVVALIATCGILSYQRYAYLVANGPDEVTSQMLQGQLEELYNVKEIWITLTVILGVIAGIAFLLIVFLRKRIQIAITLIKEGSKAVASVVSSLFFPIIPWCIQAGVIVWTVFVWFQLFSVGEPVYKARGLNGSTCVCTGDYQNLKNGDICNSTIFSELCTNSSTGTACTTAGCHFYRLQPPNYLIYFHLFNLFGFFWGVWFIKGLSDMILAGTFARWYWTFNKNKVPFFAVTSSTGRAIRYHLGTVAFGSLIISICSFIRAIIEYAEKKAKAYENSVIKSLFCCLKCFFWCLDKFLRFVNRNAYIMCAIHGRNFCLSAKDAFNLLMRNVLRVVVLDKVTDFLFFIGKLLITGGMVAASYFLFFKEFQSLHYKATVPLVIVAVGAYIIASVFFGVYAMAVDTLFLCFLEDCERNDGSREKPYFMSKNLMSILGKRNKRKREK